MKPDPRSMGLVSPLSFCMLILRLCDALSQDIVSILGQLKSDIKVTEALLRVSDAAPSSQWTLGRMLMLVDAQETRLGATVGKLRKHESQAVVSLAHELVKKARS